MIEIDIQKDDVNLKFVVKNDISIKEIFSLIKINNYYPNDDPNNFQKKCVSIDLKYLKFDL